MAVAPGVDAGQVEALLTGMRRRGAHVELVAPTLGAIETPRGSTLMPDRTFNACSPLDYDAVVVPDGDLLRLRDDGAAIAFAARAYLHGVPIGLVGAGAELLQGIAASSMQDGGRGDRGGIVHDTRACAGFVEALACRIAATRRSPTRRSTTASPAD